MLIETQQRKRDEFEAEMAQKKQELEQEIAKTLAGVQRLLSEQRRKSEDKGGDR